MTVAELRSAIKEKTFAPVYIFCGEENFLKRYYRRELARAILPDDGLDAFNHILLEGEKLDFDALSDAVAAPPMMADYKLVEWHLCDFSAMREGDLSRFAELCAKMNAYPETVLLFVVDADCLDVGTLPKRPSKLYTTLSKSAAVVPFERQDERSLGAWVARHFTHEGLSASPAVISLLLSESGTSMDALSGEIEKLAAYLKAHGRTEVTEEDVRTVCSRVSESDAFALTNAILDGRADAAYDALLDMKLRKVDPMIALGALTRSYADLLSVALLSEEGKSQKEIATILKMHEYKAGLYLRAAKSRGTERLRAALSLCRHADTASKTGTGASGYLALEYLIARVV